MAAVVALALVLPIATMWMAVRKNRPETSDITPLREALVSVSEAAFSDVALDPHTRALTLTVEDVAAERRRIEDLAARFEVTTIAVEEAPERVRLLANVPAGQEENFLQACQERESPYEMASSTAGLVDILILEK